MNMRHPAPAVLAVAWGLASVSGSSSALGGPLACRGVRLEAPPDLAPVWAVAVRDAQRTLANTLDLDCAGIDVSVSPVATDATGVDVVRVSATSTDGRHAERIVRKPSALSPTVVGLIASIPEEATRVISRTETPAGDTVPTPATMSVNAAPVPATLDVWAGLAVGARVSQPYLLEMIDFEGSADVRVKSWLLCALFRFGLGAAGEGDDATTYSETDIGLGAGRVFPLGATTLDTVFVPSVATMRFDDRDEVTTPAGSLSQLRLGARFRWSLPISASWRLTLTADSELAPQGLDHPVHTQSRLPALPAWTAGMRLGASGRLL